MKSTKKMVPTRRLTLPADAQLFARKSHGTKPAIAEVGHSGWLRKPGYEEVEYYWPKDSTCWKLLVPNPVKHDFGRLLRPPVFTRDVKLNPAASSIGAEEGNKIPILATEDSVGDAEG